MEINYTHNGLVIITMVMVMVMVIEGMVTIITP